MFGFNQVIDQCRGGGESRTPPLSARRYAQPGRKVSFPCARFTNEQNRFRACDPCPLGELMDPPCRHLWRLRKVELLKSFHPWQLRFEHPAQDRIAFSFLNLGRQ
jgi:hypothetical protein